MTRLISLACAALFVASVSMAQTLPIPPTPPAPPAAAVAPVPPMPPMAPPAFDVAGNPELEQQLEQVQSAAARAAAVAARAGTLDAQGNEDARQADEAARAAADQMRETQREVENQVREVARANMNLDQQLRGKMAFGPENDGTYDNGLRQLQQHQYDQAITSFDRVITQKGPRADGALYWKAFAEYKLAKTEDAMAALTALRSDFPQSHYLGDAKVLEVDVRKANGQPVNLDALEADEDIKVLAIQGIQKSEPEKAIPLLEGVLTASNPLRVKKEAIYVLALSDDPRAHDVLLRYAKGAGNPDLQLDAIQYLASTGKKQTTSAELKDIYLSTQDVAIRRAVIDAYRIAGDKTTLMAIASGAPPFAVIAGPTPTMVGGVTNVTPPGPPRPGRPSGSVFVASPAVLGGDMRVPAIDALGVLADSQDLWSLYQQESNPDLRMAIVGMLGSMGATDQLLQAAKTDKDASVRRRAILGLASRPTEKTGQTLVDLYGANTDKDTREAVIQALMAQNNADGLVALAHKETSLDLKRDIVRDLSAMAPQSKVAADYLMDVIK